MDLAVCAGHENDANEVADKEDFQGFSFLVTCGYAKSGGVLEIECFREVLKASRSALLSNEEMVDIETNLGKSAISSHSRSGIVEVTG